MKDSSTRQNHLLIPCSLCVLIQLLLISGSTVAAGNKKPSSIDFDAYKTVTGTKKRTLIEKINRKKHIQQQHGLHNLRAKLSIDGPGLWKKKYPGLMNSAHVSWTRKHPQKLQLTLAAGDDVPLKKRSVAEQIMQDALQDWTNRLSNMGDVGLLNHPSEPDTVRVKGNGKRIMLIDTLHDPLLDGNVKRTLIFDDNYLPVVGIAEGLNNSTWSSTCWFSIRKIGDEYLVTGLEGNMSQKVGGTMMSFDYTIRVKYQEVRLPNKKSVSVGQEITFTTFSNDEKLHARRFSLQDIQVNR